MFVRLMALQHIFERITLSRGSPDAYREYRQRKQHHITDLLEPAGDARFEHDAPPPRAAADAAAGAPGSAVPADVPINATAAALASTPRPARALLMRLRRAWGA